MQTYSLEFAPVPRSSVTSAKVIRDDSLRSASLQRKATLVNGAALKNEVGAKAVQCKSVRPQELIKTKESQPFKYEKKKGVWETVDVGKKMVAWLTLENPDIRKGQEAKENKDQNKMMDDYRRKTGLKGGRLVKGHLLNEHLGGKADNSNLYPITDGANWDHLGYVENHVKKLVLAGRTVEYEVYAGPYGNESCNTLCRKSQFKCRYRTRDTKGKKVDKSVTILSNINGKNKKARGSARDENDNKYLKEGNNVYTKGYYKHSLNKKLENYM